MGTVNSSLSAVDLSQFTLVKMVEAFKSKFPSADRRVDAELIELWLLERGFPEFFVAHAQSHYDFNWKQIVFGLRTTDFFYPGNCGPSINILGSFLPVKDAKLFGQYLLQKLAAAIAKEPDGKIVLRSLEMEGWQVSVSEFRLVRLTGPVSEQEEEERTVELIRACQFDDEAVIVKHIEMSRTHYSEGNYHECLGEARSFLQSLIDDIGEHTAASGVYTIGFPGGTKPRVQYLRDTKFLTVDEHTAILSAWGMLSAGGHPGLPAQDEARMGIILALEFGQILLTKYLNWASNGFKVFSKV